MPAPNDLRESFPALEDASTGAGVPATKSVEGDALAGKVGETVWAFQDSNGNIVHPQLNDKGQLPVTLNTAGTRSRANGRQPGAILVAPASGDYTGYVQVLSIPLSASEVVGDMCGRVVCRRSAIFELVYSDAGGSSVILDQSVCDSGQYTNEIGLGVGADTFTVPASAASPILAIRGGNFDKVSDLHATLAVTAF